MAAKNFNELFEELQSDDSYWQESAKLDFAVDLHQLMDRKGITKAELARKLNTSPAYITKVLKGDTNFTISTMVSLVRAVEGTLHLRVCDASHKARFFSWAETSVERIEHEWTEPEESGDIAQIHLEGLANESLRLAA